LEWKIGKVPLADQQLPQGWKRLSPDARELVDQVETLLELLGADEAAFLDPTSEGPVGFGREHGARILMPPRHKGTEIHSMARFAPPKGDKEMGEIRG